MVLPSAACLSLLHFPDLHLIHEAIREASVCLKQRACTQVWPCRLSSKSQSSAGSERSVQGTGQRGLELTRQVSGTGRMSW